MAKTFMIHCGSKALEFPDFEQIILAGFRSFRHLPNDDSKDLSAQSAFLIQGLAGLLYESGQRAGSTLAALISRFGFGECADKRDIVYSLLPMVNEHRGNTPPPVDYTITPAELLQRCSVYMSTVDSQEAEEGVRHLRDGLGLSDGDNPNDPSQSSERPMEEVGSDLSS